MSQRLSICKRYLLTIPLFKIWFKLFTGAGHEEEWETIADRRQQALVIIQEKLSEEYTNRFPGDQFPFFSRWRVQNTRMQTGYVPSNYVRKEKPSIFDSIKKKVRVEGEKGNWLNLLFSGERRGKPGSRQQNSSIFKLKPCAQRTPSPTHKWVPPLLSHTSIYPIPNTSISTPSRVSTPSDKRVPLLHTQQILSSYPYHSSSNPTPPHSDMKASGNRQPTTTENSEPISSAIVKYNYQVGQGHNQMLCYITIPHQAQQLDELSLVKGSRVSCKVPSWLNTLLACYLIWCFPWFEFWF